MQVLARPQVLLYRLGPAPHPTIGYLVRQRRHFLALRQDRLRVIVRAINFHLHTAILRHKPLASNFGTLPPVILISHNRRFDGESAVLYQPVKAS
jgi:hypothetical protein